jgi:hypothetical protein
MWIVMQDVNTGGDRRKETLDLFVHFFASSYGYIIISK